MGNENRKILRIKFSDSEITFIKSDTSSTPAPLNPDGIKLELRVSSIFHKALNKTRVEGIFEKNDFEILGNILFRILCLENQKDARDFVYNELSFVLREKSTRGLVILEFTPGVVHLAELPWEYLQIKKHPDKNIDSFYIGARKDEKFDLVRLIPDELQNNSKDYSSLDSGKLVVVCVISSPTGPNMRKVEKEKLEDSFKALENEFNEEDKEPFEWYRLEDPDEETFLDELKECCKLFEGPYILHFYGHARMDNDGPKIAFVDKSGEEQWVSGSVFQNYFDSNELNRLPVAIFLQACESGQINTNGEGLGIGLIEKGIPFVVAMQNEVTPETSIAFSEKFYEGLLSGDDIFRAVTRARAFLGCGFRKKNPYDHYNDNSFGTPVIFSSTTLPVRFFQPVATEDDKVSEKKLVCPDCGTVYHYNKEKPIEFCIKGRCRGRLELQKPVSVSDGRTIISTHKEVFDAHK